MKLQQVLCLCMLLVTAWATVFEDIGGGVRGNRLVEHGYKAGACREADWPMCTDSDWGPKCPSGCRIQGLLDKTDHDLLSRIAKIRHLLDQRRQTYRTADQSSKQTYDYLRDRLTTTSGNDDKYMSLADTLRKRIVEIKVKIDHQLKILEALKARVREQVIEMQRLEVDIDIKLRACKGSCAEYAEFTVDRESYVALDKQLDQLESIRVNSVETVGSLRVMKSRLLREVVVPSIYKSGQTGGVAEQQKQYFTGVSQTELTLQGERGPVRTQPLAASSSSSSSPYSSSSTTHSSSSSYPDSSSSSHYSSTSPHSSPTLPLSSSSSSTSTIHSSSSSYPHSSSSSSSSTHYSSSSLPGSSSSSLPLSSSSSSTRYSSSSSLPLSSSSSTRYSSSDSSSSSLPLSSSSSSTRYSSSDSSSSSLPLSSSSSSTRYSSSSSLPLSSSSSSTRYSSSDSSSSSLPLSSSSSSTRYSSSSSLPLSSSSSSTPDSSSSSSSHSSTTIHTTKCTRTIRKVITHTKDGPVEKTEEVLSGEGCDAVGGGGGSSMTAFSDGDMKDFFGGDIFKRFESGFGDMSSAFSSSDRAGSTKTMSSSKSLLSSTKTASAFGRGDIDDDLPDVFARSK